MSLLRPSAEDSPIPRPPVPSDEAFDLGYDSIAGWIAGDLIPRHTALAVLESLEADPETIRYRQRVFRDIHGSARLRDGLSALLPLIDEISYFASARTEMEAPFLQALWRLGELEIYVECIERLDDLLSDPELELSSEALKHLAEIAGSIRREPVFRSLAEELPKIRSGLKKRRSVTIGVNLDERLRPVEAAIISVDEEPFTQRSLLARLFPGESAAHTVTSPFHANPRPPEGFHSNPSKLPLAPLFQDLEGILKSHSRQIMNAVDRYMRVNTRFLVSLRGEIGFFIGASNLARELSDRGLPVAIPDIRSPEERSLAVEGFYNLHLATRFLRESTPRNLSKLIVLNDVSFGRGGRIFILTGPNQGGKTTWTQGIGLLHVLAQAGLFIPARSGSLSPVDVIATHFPSQEKGQLSTGRLAEEAERLSSIFERITPRSLVLLNESLSSTSPREGLSVALDIVLALRYLGARAVFATHLHELAIRCDEVNESTEGESEVVSMVAGAESERSGDESPIKRTFRVAPGPPVGLSYARDIADRFGINFPHLRTVLRAKRDTAVGSGNG